MILPEISHLFFSSFTSKLIRFCFFTNRPQFSFLENSGGRPGFSNSEIGGDGGKRLPVSALYARRLQPGLRGDSQASAPPRPPFDSHRWDKNAVAFFLVKFPPNKKARSLSCSGLFIWWRRWESLSQVLAFQLELASSRVAVLSLASSSLSTHRVPDGSWFDSRPFPPDVQK